MKIEVEGQTIELAPDALLIETTAAEGFACAEDAGYLVGLDTTLTDELVREGLIREILRPCAGRFDRRVVRRRLRSGDRLPVIEDVSKSS